MTLNESIVEDAGLILPAATLTPALSHGEREPYSEVVLVGRLREAILSSEPEFKAIFQKRINK